MKNANIGPATMFWNCIRNMDKIYRSLRWSTNVSIMSSTYNIGFFGNCRGTRSKKKWRENGLTFVPTICWIHARKWTLGALRFGASAVRSLSIFYVVSASIKCISGMRQIGWSELIWTTDALFLYIIWAFSCLWLQCWAFHVNVLEGFQCRVRSHFGCSWAIWACMSISYQHLMRTAATTVELEICTRASIHYAVSNPIITFQISISWSISCRLIETKVLYIILA